MGERHGKRVILTTWAALLLAILACNPPTQRTPGAPPTAYVVPTLTSPEPAEDTASPVTPTAEPASPPSTAAAPTDTPPSPAPTTPATTMPIDFETWGVWRRGDQPNGTFEQSSEQVHGGSFAGRLSYDFPTSGNDFVVFVEPVPLPGTPNRIRAWVYGDGSGHFLNVWIRDAEGEVWQATFGRVDHTGWRRMTAEIEVGQEWPWGHVSGPDDGAVDYPIEFYALALDDGEDPFVGTGTLFVDDITVP